MFGVLKFWRATQGRGAPRAATLAWLLALSAPVGLVGCDLALTDEDGEAQCLDDFLREKGTDREALEAQAAQQGIDASTALKRIYDSVFGVVDVLVDCSASEALGGLAAGTGGQFERVKTPAEGMDKVSTFTGQVEGNSVDLVFLVDTTGSMSSSIETVRDRLGDIVATLEGKDVRVAIAFYRDQNVDDPWYFRNASGLTRADASEITSFLASAQASGGGDFPESLYDGVFKTVTELDWAAETRLLVAITDAPPLTGDKSDNTQATVVAACAAQDVRVLTVQVSLF